MLVEDTLEISVQVNGKLRDVVKVPATASRTVFDHSHQGGRASPRAQISREAGQNSGLARTLALPTAILQTASQTELEAVAKGREKMKPFLEGKTVKQVIVLPKKPVILLVA